MALLSRFDAAALRPPTVDVSADDGPTLPIVPTLVDWSTDRIGRHDAPRFALAVLRSADALRATRVADALARTLDGTDRLVALPRLAGLLWRLRIKLAEACWWRAPRANDVWDAGFVIDTPAGLAALARFTPRRPTLVVADALAEGTLAQVVDALQSRATAFRYPVRLLVVAREASARPPAGNPPVFTMDRVPGAGRGHGPRPPDVSPP